MQLLAPLFLLGLAAMAVPIWLHRREGAPALRRAVSSLMFFEPGVRASQSLRRLRDLWLLALRLLLLAALCLAFAQPVWVSGALGFRSEPAELAIVVVDTSLSMSAGERWPRAQQEAARILGELGERDWAQLVRADAQLVALGEPSRDRALLRSLLGELEPGALPLRYGGLLARIETLVEEARAQALRGGGIELRPVVHVISDFQLAAAPPRWIDRMLRGGAALQLHAVAQAQEPNWFVEQARAQALGGGRQRVEAVVRGFATPARELELELWVDGARSAALRKEVAADSRTAFEFEIDALSEGAHRAELVLAAQDALALDDRRRLVLVERAPSSLLLASDDLGGREALYFGAALGADAGPEFALTQARPRQLAEQSLDGVSLVVVSDAVLDAPAAERLREFARSGRSLWLTVGERALRAGRPLLSGHALSGAAAAPDPAAPFGVTRSGRAEPELGDRDVWRAVQLYRHARVEALPGDEVLLRTSAGEPLLIEHRLGAGRVWIYAGALDPAWTDLPLSPVFVAFARGGARWLAGVGESARERSAGERLALGLGPTGEPREYSVQLLDPDGSRMLALAETRSARDVALERLGFFSLLRGSSEQPIAVNSDPLESDLRAMDAAELARWTQDAAEQSAAWQQREAEQGEERSHTPLAAGLLWLVALVLLGEPALSQWIRRPPRKEQHP